MYKGYIHLNYKPSENDLVCEFRIEPAKGVSMRMASEAVAAESSVGTWTDVKTAGPNIMRKAAKVFYIKPPCVRIAYPSELFEAGNMPCILSSVAGNVFGMKELNNLRLEDIHWPEWLMKSFKGPLYGIPGVRKILNVYDRPLCGTIIKPKLGLGWREHAKVAYEAWCGGIDIVKDDENLTSQSFNKFEERVTETLRLRDKAETETGERKMYMANVSAETNEMIRRAKFVKNAGGEYVMVDILTVGWAGLQTLRDANEELRLVLHAHRAGHAAMTRNKRHGISMLVIADIARLIGVDQLHIGTAVGKMEGPKKEVIELGEEIEKGFLMEKGHRMSEQWRHLKPVFAVCSGGLHPGHVPTLVRMLGNDIIIQAGGGVHGHPKGTRAGATAMRQAINAVMEGKTLSEYAKMHKELKAVIDKWGWVK
ncbi:MAG: type III ribulose-bisphosphate carboxylase [Candidatus Aenigmatarchaeota archaeon]|nr:type III ribulose-bisphosphate carboxylase [Candidatus Aenigmarchaeota archaeon]